jgi:ubiquinone biosynthesis protein UbiJ
MQQMQAQNQAAAKEIEDLRQQIGDAFASGDVTLEGSVRLVQEVGALMMLLKETVFSFDLLAQTKCSYS